ncbi:MAG TPA: sialidase family protein [Caulifigura sp.]|nr:sialidase family protein [Caulifigura sp.]
MRLSTLLLLASTWLTAATTAPAAEPFLEKVDLFKAGDDGYAIYHIPGLAVTANGTVLASCEARRVRSDWDMIDILLRRSEDGGRTWSKAEKVVDVPGPKTKNPVALRLKNVKPTDVTYNNPVLIADRDGTVHFLFCLEYFRCFSMSSKDDGRTWSAPVEITRTFEAFRKHYDWKVLATGPDHGIQLSNGRLIVPVWLSTATGGNAHRPSVSSTIYSDDHGQTWHAGEIAVPLTDEIINPSETLAIELADGRVMLNARNESKAHRRLVTISPDGATNWSTPKFDDTLIEPICMGSLIRLSSGKTGGKNRILFANPANLERADGKAEPGKGRDRKNMTVRVSYDEGETWPVAKSVEPGWAAYSDLAVTKDGTILCFYGTGLKPDFAGEKLTVARFNLEWLTDGNDSLTPSGERGASAPRCPRASRRSTSSFASSASLRCFLPLPRTGAPSAG